MNILFCSVPFRPSIGGIETVSALLAEHFHRAGHRVVLVTQTPSDEAAQEAFEVVRRPSARQLFELVRRADVVFHNNISLRLAWPLPLLRRPWVVAHHTWIPRNGMAARLKRFVIRHASNVAISHAVADSLPVPCTLVPNPYADDLFVRGDESARRRELVFVGRLVSDKGVDRLLSALERLSRAGRPVGLTVVGVGPEEEALRRQAAQAGLSGSIDFAGRRTGEDLVAILQAHQVLVVPSVWEEPFGIVALEAIACGCVPLVTRRGGLPDAVGDCGRVVAHDDIDALAEGIATLLDQPGTRARHLAAAAAHLARHTRERVAHDYLRVLEETRQNHVGPRAASVA